MTEDQAREIVTATCQVLEWTYLCTSPNEESNGINRFPIRFRTPKPFVMADDWVPDIFAIGVIGYEIFGFYTWLNAFHAMTNIGNLDYDHRSHQTPTDYVQASR